MTVIYEDQVLYAKPKNEVLFERIKLLYAELSPFQIQLFMAQLSQILNIRHLQIQFIQTILILLYYLKIVACKRGMHGYSNIVSDGIDSPFRNRTQMLFRIVFLNTRCLLAYYYLNQINKLLNK